MKKMSLGPRWPYFLGQRSHGSDSSGNMPELINPESELPRAEGLIEDILRWADDGGKMLDLGENRKARSNPQEKSGEQRLNISSSLDSQEQLDNDDS